MMIDTVTKHVLLDPLSQGFMWNHAGESDKIQYNSEAEATTALNKHLLKRGVEEKDLISNKGLVYISAPYSALNEIHTGYQTRAVRETRMAYFSRVMNILDERGLMTVSPLLKHYILNDQRRNLGWQYWQEYSLAMMDKCSAMIVIDMFGTEESVGVQGEIDYAKKIDLHYCMVDVEGHYINRYL